MLMVVLTIALSLALGLIQCTNTKLAKDTKNAKEKETAHQLLKRYQMECIEETRVDPDMILKVRKGDWTLIPTAQVHLIKNWSLCVFLKTGLMTKQGVYKIDVALEKVPKHARNGVEKLIDFCLSTKAIPASDIAFNFMKCYQKSKGNYTVSII